MGFHETTIKLKKRHYLDIHEKPYWKPSSMRANSTSWSNFMGELDRALEILC